KSERLIAGKDIAIIAVGSMVKTGQEVAKMLGDMGKDITLVNGRFISPIDKNMIDELANSHSLLITMEENVRNGGFGQKVSDYLCDKQKPIKFINISVPDEFVDHGGTQELHQRYGLDPDSIVDRIMLESESL
ncbi:MAG TPA: 1-deoxy-D-xylulose-5-phosphate synthase, partial [Clostridiales bacterium]|nr:1-deoxy-D-xylulose-5-phosphate synthase [Clostridiales bacterium]